MSSERADAVLVPRLVPLITCTTLESGHLRFEAPGWSSTLATVPPGIAQVLAELDERHLSIAEMMNEVSSADGPPYTGLFLAHLWNLAEHRLVSFHLIERGREFASIEPTGSSFRFRPLAIPSESHVRLSRFTFLRRDCDDLILESGMRAALVRLHEPALAALVASLAAGTTAHSFEQQAGTLGVSPDVTAGLLTILDNGCHLEWPSDAGRPPEPELWDPRDLLFHATSRFGRMGGSFGGMFLHIGEEDPEPAVRPLPDGPRIPLERPDLDTIMKRDPPLQQVIEQRVSTTSYGDEPITADQLSEFLFRVARVRWRRTSYVTSLVTGKTGEMEMTSRPYPSGGRGYELDLYLTVAACDGIEAGMYHYDPEQHQLTQIRPFDDMCQQMIGYARITSAGADPHILITFASRFRRMSWKYDRMAYSATLKNVGVLMQQMYLVATAMGLAACAQGSGDIEQFAAASGNDPLTEGSVGEFILGSLPSRAAAGTAETPRPSRPDRS